MILCVLYLRTLIPRIADYPAKRIDELLPYGKNPVCERSIGGGKADRVVGVVGRIAEVARRRLLQVRLRGRDFTIISNNCWGAHIYQRLGEPYRTPFVGVFLAPTCYLNLIERTRWYLNQPLYFLSQSRHPYIEALRDKRQLRYPIGCLGGNVEIQFLHYTSEAEAAEKWARRVARVSRSDDRFFFKFDDRDGCAPEQLSAFDRAPRAHKVCFISKQSAELQSVVWILEASGDSVPDGWELSRISPRYFDAVGWLKGSDGRMQKTPITERKQGPGFFRIPLLFHL